jgi:hypothetical protein
MILATIDPGIKATSVALWDPHERHPPSLRDPDGFYGAAYALLARTTLRTRRASSVLRCVELDRLLWQYLDEMARGCGQIQVVIELPPAWHAKNQKGRRSWSHLLDSMHKLNRAIGALAAGAARFGADVYEIPAAKDHKEARRERVDAALRIAGKPESRNEHEADAIFIGLCVVSGVVTLL